jgi:hypothetical protein
VEADDAAHFPVLAFAAEGVKMGVTPVNWPLYSPAMKDAALPVETELLAEKAAALGRAGETLAAALVALRKIEAELAAAGHEERPSLRVRQREARDVAAERLWYVLVQREAIGIFHHEGLMREQRVPPEVRLLAGPRRRR